MIIAIVSLIIVLEFSDLNVLKSYWIPLFSLITVKCGWCDFDSVDAAPELMRLKIERTASSITSVFEWSRRWING